MIIIRDWSAIIPEEDRHIAYVGEGESVQKEFFLTGKDWDVYRHWHFHLDMAFDLSSVTTCDHRQVEKVHKDVTEQVSEAQVKTNATTTKENYTVDTVSVEPYNETDIAYLTTEEEPDGLRLTWTVLRQQTQLPGKLTATLRAVGPNQEVKKSQMMVFEVDPSVQAEAAVVPSVSEFQQMEQYMGQMCVEMRMLQVDMADSAAVVEEKAQDVQRMATQVQNGVDSAQSAADAATAHAAFCEERARAVDQHVATTATQAQGAAENSALAQAAARQAEASKDAAIDAAADAVGAALYAEQQAGVAMQGAMRAVQTVSQLAHTGKNLMDPTRILVAADGSPILNVGDDGLPSTDPHISYGACTVYGYYELTVGQPYTISHKLDSQPMWLYFYQSDGTPVVYDHTTGAYAMAMGQYVPSKTFDAIAPLVLIKTKKDPLLGEIQLEQGATPTTFEAYGVRLDENILIPVVGTGELSTDADTLIGAVNELHSALNDGLDTSALEQAVANVTETVIDIDKRMPRMNEPIIRWTDGFIDKDGTIKAVTSGGYAYSNRCLLRAGATYLVRGPLQNYTAFYDAEDTFLGRGSDYAGVTVVSDNGANSRGTITIGEQDVYARFQSVASNREKPLYVSRWIDSVGDSGICEPLLINHHMLDKKVLILGDSISTGDTSAALYSGEKYGSYNKWVEALADSHYWDAAKVRNDSIHATGFVARFNGEDDLISRLRKVNRTDYDLVIVFAGINDSLRANKLEIGFGMDEQGNKQTDITRYFVPAVDTFFAELVEKFAGARIAVVLPLRTRYSHAGHGMGPQNLLDGSKARPETDYADYIAQVAEEYCLPVLDATHHSGFAPFHTAQADRWVFKAERGGGDTTLVPDGVHPNEDFCRLRLAPYIRGFIDGLL